MNIFGAFTFGSLIKTFLPGFVWLIAISLLESDISQFLSSKPHIMAFAEAHDQAALVLAIPASILLGLVSNIIVFMGINDWLVRNPVKKANPDLFTLYDKIAAEIRHKYSSSIEDTKLRESFNSLKDIDVEYMMLPIMGIDKYSFIREQYWYHLEFQINLFLSLIALLFASLFPLRLIQSWELTFCAHAFILTVLLASALLIKAARKNFQRHVSKMLSLLTALLVIEEQKSASERPG
jgi:hypothetical protein